MNARYSHRDLASYAPPTCYSTLQPPNHSALSSTKIASTEADTTNATPLYASEAETKLKLTKRSREEDIKVAREQILRWQKLLLQVCIFSQLEIQTSLNSTAILVVLHQRNMLKCS